MASTGLAHVRFTFDRTPFRRMLRALDAAGSQTSPMQLLPPQITILDPVQGTITSSLTLLNWETLMVSTNGPSSGMLIGLLECHALSILQGLFVLTYGF